MPSATQMFTHLWHLHVLYISTACSWVRKQRKNMRISSSKQDQRLPFIPFPKKQPISIQWYPPTRSPASQHSSTMLHDYPRTLLCPSLFWLHALLVKIFRISQFWQPFHQWQWQLWEYFYFQVSEPPHNSENISFSPLWVEMEISTF